MSSSKKTAPFQDVVFEIGSEELPATNLADLFESAAAEGADNALLVKWKDLFAANRIAIGPAKVWATPRRLIFHAEKVATQQEKKDQLTRLLTQSEAYDAAGKPTDKFLTILKHRGVALSDTVIQEAQGKPTVFIRKAEPVRKTVVVLAELLDGFVRGLGFPKNMKWDDSGLVFPRPIRHALCFYGDQPVRFTLGSTRSSERVWFFAKGRRWSVPVKGCASYFSALKKQGVLADPVERKSRLQEILAKASKAHRGELYDDPFLLSEVNFLVEDPDVVAAPFDEEFLKLPLEVLAVSMARKQRIFGLVDTKGRVLPRFLGILDGKTPEKDKKIISRNYENILRAKLKDSLFFYKEDVKAPLEKKREELKNLIFLKGAGSMLEKSQRLEELAGTIGPLVFAGRPEKVKALQRAAHLSKCDLLTQMVGEFPELQGTMGKYYSIAGGESAEVGEAIGEQYLPRTVSDRVPRTDVGAFLSILDKMDLIAAAFALHMQPSSSLDPYGLRRSASAIFKIIIEHRFAVSASAIAKHCLSGLSGRVANLDVEAVHRKLTEFLKDRFKSVLLDKGFRADHVDAVMTKWDRPMQELYPKLEFLRGNERKKEFVEAQKVVERTSNILKGNKEVLPERPDPAVFTEPLERELFEVLQRNERPISEAIRTADYAGATSLYAGAFFAILNQFFDKVFINAEDLNVRRSRLSLLKAVKDLYTSGVADLSKIQVPTGATSPSKAQL